MEGLLSNPLTPIFACIALGWVASSVCQAWCKVRRDAIEADLKREMLQRGMSADEIVMVISGKPSKTSSAERVSSAPAKPAAHAKGV